MRQKNVYYIHGLFYERFSLERWRVLVEMLMRCRRPSLRPQPHFLNFFLMKVARTSEGENESSDLSRWVGSASRGRGALRTATITTARTTRRT